MYIFISHSSKEAEVATGLCHAIEAGGHSCFMAPRDIRSGYEYAEEIANGIDGADAVLLILSKASNGSPHVLREVERAVSKGIPIIVYKLEPVELTKSMEYFLMTHQWMEAGKDSYEDVVRCIDNLGGAEKTIEATQGKSEEKDRGNKRMLAIAGGIILVLLVIIVILVVKLVSVGGDAPEEPHFSEENSVAERPEVALGDTIVMGSYNGEDISWRVLKISEDGTEAVIVARDVLTMKAYDAPDSGKFNHDGEESYFFSDAQAKLEADVELKAYVQGNSSWEGSTIRTWLNSAKENVEYMGQAPTPASMPEGANAYHTEKGFLCNFTEDELARIKTTTVETKGNVLSGADTIITEDKVFLLSMKELEWFQEADVSMLAVPTEDAIAKDGIGWYRDYCLGYHVEHMMWWLREPVENSAAECYLVGNGYREDNIYTSVAGAECYGIRPAMTIDLTIDVQ